MAFKRTEPGSRVLPPDPRSLPAIPTQGHQALADTASQIMKVVENLSNAWVEKEAKRRTKDGTLEGAAAGARRDADGALLAPDLGAIDVTTYYGTAFYNAATESYTSAFRNDARAAAAKIAVDTKDDTVAYDTAWQQYVEGTLENTPPELRENLAQDLKVIHDGKYIEVYAAEAEKITKQRVARLNADNMALFDEAKTAIYQEGPSSPVALDRIRKIQANNRAMLAAGDIDQLQFDQQQKDLSVKIARTTAFSYADQLLNSGQFGKAMKFGDEFYSAESKDPRLRFFAGLTPDERAALGDEVYSRIATRVKQKAAGEALENQRVVEMQNATALNITVAMQNGTRFTPEQFDDLHKAGKLSDAAYIKFHGIATESERTRLADRMELEGASVVQQFQDNLITWGTVEENWYRMNATQRAAAQKILADRQTARLKLFEELAKKEAKLAKEEAKLAKAEKLKDAKLAFSNLTIELAKKEMAPQTVLNILDRLYDADAITAEQRSSTYMKYVKDWQAAADDRRMMAETASSLEGGLGFPSNKHKDLWHTKMKNEPWMDPTNVQTQGILRGKTLKAGVLFEPTIEAFRRVLTMNDPDQQQAVINLFFEIRDGDTMGKGNAILHKSLGEPVYKQVLTIGRNLRIFGDPQKAMEETRKTLIDNTAANRSLSKWFTGTAQEQEQGLRSVVDNVIPTMIDENTGFLNWAKNLVFDTYDDRFKPFLDQADAMGVNIDEDLAQMPDEMRQEVQDRTLAILTSGTADGPMSAAKTALHQVMLDWGPQLDRDGHATWTRFPILWAAQRKPKPDFVDVSNLTIEQDARFKLRLLMEHPPSDIGIENWDDVSLRFSVIEATLRSPDGPSYTIEALNRFGMWEPVEVPTDTGGMSQIAYQWDWDKSIHGYVYDQLLQDDIGRMLGRVWILGDEIMDHLIADNATDYLAVLNQRDRNRDAWKTLGHVIPGKAGDKIAGLAPERRFTDAVGLEAITEDRSRMVLKRQNIDQITDPIFGPPTKRPGPDFNWFKLEELTPQ